jgi:hypothetical protein
MRKQWGYFDALYELDVFAGIKVVSLKRAVTRGGEIARKVETRKLS